MELETLINEKNKTWQIRLLTRGIEEKALLTYLNGQTCTLEYDNWCGKLTFRLRPAGEPEEE